MIKLKFDESDIAPVSYLNKFLTEHDFQAESTDENRDFLNKIEKKYDYETIDSIIDKNLLIKELGLNRSFINNRRYLGNKYSLSNFIRKVVNENCNDINTVADIFSGTGAVSYIFKDKKIITNDLLYSNYITNYAFFYPKSFSTFKIIKLIYEYNLIQTKEKNYMRNNFANTYFSADDCSKIGYIREDIEKKYKKLKINFKEYSILITSLLYAMDKIANTVGHYDAYRQNEDLKSSFKMNVIIPEKNLNDKNECYNLDANELIKKIECDLLYLDPPYNSRQYSDSYHLLENVARWDKPKVYGVAKKMDRSNLKSKYSMVSAPKALKDLVENSKAKYILLSYNTTSDKADGRSNAKISDSDIYKIFKNKGDLKVFEKDYKMFTTGKTNKKNNKERLFLCKVIDHGNKNIESPFNYTGGKYKILSQIQPLFHSSSTFLDLFAGGANVGINSNSDTIILNDKNKLVIELIEFIRDTDTSTLLDNMDGIINQYGLSDTRKYGYNYYGTNSSKGLSKYNKDKYLKLREAFNKLYKKNIIDYNKLYMLIVFSFNNQIRFNKKGMFNLPVGKRDFNLNMRQKLIAFSEKLKEKEIHFLNKDFRELSLILLPKDTLIYCDPPYLIGNASYNENGGWSEKDEVDLLLFLDQANAMGYKFALSNVTKHKNKQNKILIDWLNEMNYNINYIDKSYSNSNYQRKSKDSITEEVLITNY